jgi:hypothetical protein
MPARRDTMYGKLSEDTQKQVNTFIDDYRKMFENGNVATTRLYEQVVEEASKKFKDYPELKEAYDKYTKWRQENKRAQLDEDDTDMVLGYVLATDVNSANREFKPSEADKAFVFEAYTNWLDNNDFVPDDRTLAHFARIPELVFEEVRTELVGYQLEETDNGFKVLERPNPYLVKLLSLIPAEEKTEASKLLEELLQAA